MKSMNAIEKPMTVEKWMNTIKNFRESDETIEKRMETRENSWKINEQCDEKH